jgi:hypothetical protein
MEITGKHLSFRELKNAIDESDKQMQRIMIVLVMLADKETEKRASRRKLAEQFITYYSPMILVFLNQFTKNYKALSRVKVLKSREYVERMEKMRRDGVISNCSNPELAQAINNGISIKYEFSSLCKLLQMFTE